MHLRRRRQPIAARHLDVEQRHVGLRGQRGGQYLIAARDLGDDLHVGLQREQRPKRAPHHRLIFSQQYTNHRCPTQSLAPVFVIRS